LREFVEFLSANGIAYLVAGAFAVAWHGYAPFKADIDFLVRLDRSHAELVVKALRDLGFARAGISPEDLTQTGRIAQLGVNSLDGLSVAYIGREALIRNKELTGRPQDIGDAQRLRQRPPRLWSAFSRLGYQRRMKELPLTAPV